MPKRRSPKSQPQATNPVHLVIISVEVAAHVNHCGISRWWTQTDTPNIAGVREDYAFEFPDCDSAHSAAELARELLPNADVNVCLAVEHEPAEFADA